MKICLNTCSFQNESIKLHFEYKKYQIHTLIFKNNFDTTKVVRWGSTTLFFLILKLNICKYIKLKVKEESGISF